MKHHNKYIKYKLKYNLLKGGNKSNKILICCKNEEERLKIINDIIKKYFLIYKLININASNDNIYDNIYDIIIECENEQPSKFRITQSTNKISINALNKCKINNSTGSIILNKIILIAKELKIKSIVLIDAAMIKNNGCEFRLSYYYILLHGYSFYNKFGFYSFNFDNEKINNELIRNYTFETYLDEIILAYKNSKIPELKNNIQQLRNINVGDDSIVTYTNIEMDRILSYIKKNEMLCNILFTLNNYQKKNILTKNTPIKEIIRIYDDYQKNININNECLEINKNINKIVSLGEMLLNYDFVLELKL